jgi:hypothetical protein
MWRAWGVAQRGVLASYGLAYPLAIAIQGRPLLYKDRNCSKGLLVFMMMMMMMSKQSRNSTHCPQIVYAKQGIAEDGKGQYKMEILFGSEVHTRITCYFYCDLSMHTFDA